MDSNKNEPAFEFLPLFKSYADGRIERLYGEDFVPPATDTSTGVTSKDIIINPQTGVSARLYLPANAGIGKLPLVVYFHGGGFIVSTPFNSRYHNYLNLLVGESNVVALSVHYRRAPENPLPAAYEDSWAAVQWAAAHRNGNGPEPWLNQYADFGRVFLAGDSAGANIAHNIAMVAGNGGLDLGIDLLGIALVHPYFWASDPGEMSQEKKASVDRLWLVVCPSSTPVPGQDDPWLNPVADGGVTLARLGCRRVLVCVAGKDVLRDRGRIYYEALGRSGWMGVVVIEETEDEGHVFHLNDLGCEKARTLTKSLAEFFNRGMPPLI